MISSQKKQVDRKEFYWKGFRKIDRKEAQREQVGRKLIQIKVLVRLVHRGNEQVGKEHIGIRQEGKSFKENWLVRWVL